MESKFLTELYVKQDPNDESLWIILKKLEYQSHLLNGGIIVPSGFVTDFASVPRIPIVYNIFGNRAHREAVIHDFLYQTHLLTRSKADEIFLEAMKARGKSWALRRAMYLGVRMGGASSYASGPRRFKMLNPERLPR